MRYRQVFSATLRAAALGAACLLVSACYITEQGTRYLAIRSKAIPVAKALADTKITPEVRALLERVAEVRVFASAKLGLKQTKNYTSIVMTDRDHLADIVSACAELSFDRYLWSYPLVGKLPYQGYFTLSEAQAESARLKKKGLDTLVRQVDAFSTLGWLKDPLFSFMSGYAEADIADLIIHESTHATVFVNRYTDFDEELAVFVGGQGSLLWLESKYGKDSPQAVELQKDRADDAAFTAWLRGTAVELEKLYATKMDDAEKRRQKDEIIASRAAQFKSEYAQNFKSDRYKDFHMERINNAYLDLYRLYEGEPELYHDYFEKLCGSSIPRLMTQMSRIAKLGGDPRDTMRKELAAAG